MSPNRLFYIIKRIKDLKIQGTINAIRRRIRPRLFRLLFKEQALRRQFITTWEYFQRFSRYTDDFENFFKNIQQHWITPNYLYHHQLFKKYCTPEPFPFSETIRKAQDATAHTFSILGSEKTSFTLKTLPWHHDFKQQSLLPFFTHIDIRHQYDRYRNTFYQDISINPYTADGIATYQADIKTIWDFSRMHHIFDLGQAYQATKDPQYAMTFINHITSWIDNNPYLLGVNWKCPMDVAIRAINMLWGVHFFIKSSHIPLSFWERLVCSLFDHLRYLEFNWEESDRANNHYLADLVGYAYLVDFFKRIPSYQETLASTLHLIWTQFSHQVSHDGTAYEGSTAYHHLDTELYLHAMLLAQANNITVPNTTHARFEKMITFLKHIHINQQEIVKIGDDDSGKILTGITTPFTTTDPFFYRCYKNFGLTIIKTPFLHVTFRHPTYATHQPTGHFHYDELAMTIAYKGIPIITDSGSFIYTGNSVWRNKLRSVAGHSTFFSQESKRLHITEQDLFQLKKAPYPSPLEPLITTNKITVTDTYSELSEDPIVLTRSITIDKHQPTIYISDHTISCRESKIIWHFILHPAITWRPDSNTTLKILFNNIIIGQVKSSLALTLQEGWYAPAYGILKKTCIAHAVDISNKAHKTEITFY